MSYFSIAGMQLALPAHNNLDILEQKTINTCKLFPWINMVVFGELAICGPGIHHSEAISGIIELRLQELAKNLGIWLIPGSYYEKADGFIYNCTPVINPDGEIVARYRKIYPFLPYEKGVANGLNFITFDVPNIGRFGVSICYDMWIPESIRALVYEGAEVIIHPTMTGTVDRELELCLARSHAITNQCFFFDINNAGDLGNGQSIVVGPDGDIIFQAGEGEQVIPLEIDLNRVRRSRERGVLGLGQPLKSFRDNPIHYPQYHGRSAHFDMLGYLQVPAKKHK